ncbi:MAG: Crp/Fnr family transcriptional regulator [Rhizobiales bacterium]|nr:Crp/Fnr family transcriptional regulator [Hyphomicrobiales bacterium]
MHQITDVELFSDLDERQAERLARHCRWSQHDPNELIIDYGEETSEIRFVVSGKVRILLRTPTGKEVILTEMGPGHYFGEMAAIDGSSRSANVTALEHCEMCVMPATAFVEALNEIPAISNSVLKRLCGHVRELNHRLGEHAFLTTRQRLCALLLRLSKPRAQAPSERIISPPPLQKDLADHIGTQREVVTRELSALKKLGLVDSTRGGLVLLKPDGLNQIISDALPQ